MPAFRSSIAHATQHSSLPAGPGANGGPTDVEAHYAAVCAVLWSERELLESLACTAIVDQLMTHAAAARGGSDTVRRESLRRLGLQEVLRAAIVDALISATSSPPAAGLGELADSAPDPWRTILAEHLEVMRSLATDVSALFGFEQRSLNDFLA